MLICSLILRTVTTMMYVPDNPSQISQAELTTPCIQGWDKEVNIQPLCEEVAKLHLSRQLAPQKWLLS